MYAYDRFMEEVAAAIETATGRKPEPRHLAKPPDASMGDLSCTLAFDMAKERKKNPAELAKEIAAKCKPAGLVSRVEARGPYVNFFMDEHAFAGRVLEECLKKDYGHSEIGKGKKILLEYSQPNPNKPMHVGHLRNTLLGGAVANILEAAGHKVVRANYMNDKGVHICKAMLAYQKWGEAKEPDRKPDHFVGNFYSLFGRKAQEDPGLEKEALELLAKWEACDPAARALQEKLVNWCYDGLKQTYSRLGSRFDVWFYESQIYEHSRKIIDDGLKSGALRKDAEGAVIAPLEEYSDLPNKVILRPDGTSVYVVADLALAAKKFKDYKPDLSMYCVGSDQDTYFRQLFKIIEQLGIAPVEKCYHLSYGMVYLPSGKMSSREGTVINADDLMDEVAAAAAEETKKREIVAAGRAAKVAETIAVGAIKFTMLKTDPKKTILFEKDKVVSFEGDTGPYLQYAHVRCCGILDKLGKPGKPDPALLKSAHEAALVKKLAEYPNILRQAAASYNPAVIAQYLIELSHVFSAFYENCPVLKAETPELKASRAALISAFRAVLASGLGLLGIQAPEAM